VNPSAIDVGDVRNIGTGTLIALAVIALLLVLFVKNLIVRVVVVVVAIGLGIWVWQQRASIQDKLTKDKCQLSATFFGVHVRAPADVVQACRTHTS
jgi:Flp pilus assembly protein TadB